MVAYHSGAEQVLTPRAMMHIGTLAQAAMRGGRHMHRIEFVTGPRVPRLRDTGSWNVRALRRHACRANVATYLNRHEGIPPQEFERARQRCDIDRATDSVFRRLLPSAADSWIILNAASIRSVENIGRI